jgi:hypothetical protein
MIQQQIVLNGTYSNLTKTFGPIALPVGLSVVRAWIDISQMVTPDQGFTFVVEISQDAGATWAHLMGGSRTGEVIINPKTSVVQTQAMVQIGLDQPANVNRRVRGSLVMTGTVPVGVLLEAV